MRSQPVLEPQQVSCVPTVSSCWASAPINSNPGCPQAGPMCRLGSPNSDFGPRHHAIRARQVTRVVRKIDV